MRDFDSSIDRVLARRSGRPKYGLSSSSDEDCLTGRLSRARVRPVSSSPLTANSPAHNRRRSPTLNRHFRPTSRTNTALSFLHPLLLCLTPRNVAHLTGKRRTSTRSFERTSVCNQDDENDDAIVAALLCWRRHVISRHFLAWRIMVRHKLYRHTREHQRVARALSHSGKTLKWTLGDEDTGLDSPSPRLWKSPVNLATATPTHTKRSSFASNEITRVRRREFQASLQLIYFTFTKWKLVVAELQHEAHEQEHLANMRYRENLTRSVIVKLRERAAYRKMRSLHWRSAIYFSDIHSRKRHFLRWKRTWKLICEIRRRLSIMSNCLLGLCWHQWVDYTMTHLLNRKRFEQTRSFRLRQAIKRYRRSVDVLKSSRKSMEYAIIHRNQKLRLIYFMNWKASTFCSPKYLTWISRKNVRYAQTGVRRWRQFIKMRRCHAHQLLAADLFSYKRALQTPFFLWKRFLKRRLNYRSLINRAIIQYDESILRRSLEFWMQYRHICFTNKSKIVAASSWYITKKLRYVFRDWHHITQHTATLRQFYRAILHRRLRLVVRAWQSWASKHYFTKRKRQLVERHRLECLMGKTFSTWRNIFVLHIALLTADFNRNKRVTKDSFCQWREKAAILRRHRIAVESIQMKASLLCLLRALRGWNETVKRYHCYRQLIRLFRKKIKRRRLQQAFRMLCIGIRCDRYQQKLNNDSIRNCFALLKNFTAISKSKQTSTQLATEYFYSQRCSFAIRMWRQMSYKRIRHRRATLIALKHNYETIMRKTLYLWYRITRHLCKRKTLLRSSKHEREQRCSRSIVWNWYIFVQNQRKCERLVKTFIMKRWSRLIEHAWRAWLDFMKLRQMSNRHRKMAIASHSYRICFKAMKAWRALSTQQNYIRIKCGMIRETSTQRLMKVSIMAWKKCRLHRVAARQQLELAASFHKETLLYHTLLAWQTFWYSATLKRDQATTVAELLSKRRLRSAIHTWYQIRTLRKSSRQTYTLADHHYNRVLQRRGVVAWSQLYVMRRHGRKKQKLAISHYRYSMVQQLFCVWKSYSFTQRAFKRYIIRVFESDERFSISRLFHCWKHYRRSSTLHSIAYRFYSRKLLYRIWAQWVSHLRFVVAINHSALVTDRLRRVNMLRTTFHGWKEYLHQRWLQQDRLDAANKQYTQNQRRLGIRRWRYFHVNVQQLHTAVEFAENISKRQYLSRWRFFLKQRHCRERNLEKSGNWRRNALMANSFGFWARSTLHAVQYRVDKADAHFSCVVVKKAWILWLQLHKRCHSARVVHLRQQLSSTRKCWLLWCRFISSEADRKQQLSIVSIFNKTTLRRRTWRAWLRYLGERQLKIDQQEQAQAHFQQIVLRRRCFANWLRYTKEMRYHHERVALAAEYVDHARIRSVLIRWTQFWQKRRCRKHRHDLLQKDLQNQRLARFMGKWNSQTKLRKMHKSSLITASRHFRQKQLSTAVSLLLAAMTSRKAVRIVVLQEKAHRFKVLQLKSFKKWQSFLAWRKRNRRLVTLFRESKKDDYFARWKIFYKRKTAMRIAKAAANDLYIATTNRRTVARWVSFVYYCNLNARAQSFNTNRLLRQHISLWRRKVKMLKDLRYRVRNYISSQLCTYFSAWKRVVCTRKQRMKNMKRATRFMNRSRIEKRWRCWVAFICGRRKMYAVFQSAERFRQRFLAWRVFIEWKSRARYGRRKRVLGSEATARVNHRKEQRCMQAWLSWHRQRQSLQIRQVRFSTIVASRRCNQAIQALKELCIARNASKEKKKRAHSFCQHQRLAGFWQQWQKWCRIAKTAKAQCALADARGRRACQKKYFSILRKWFTHCKIVRESLSVFRQRYFGTMLENCFYRWRCTVTLRLDLRALVYRNRTRRRKEVLKRWHQNSALLVRYRLQRHLAIEHHRSRELRRWLQHWESVTTDRWIERQLVTLHERDQGRRLTLEGICNWQEATKTKRERRHTVIAAVWKKWRDLSKLRSQTS